jgi:uncharacterized protein YecE (DUF72 family)
VTLHVGTSGWAYKGWKPDFYPPKLPQARFLEHYATLLNACEVNNTFYRLPAATTFDKWATVGSDRFRFAVKAHRALTHRKAVAPEARTREFMAEFVGKCSTLGPRLGVVLFQFPLFTERDDEGLTKFLEALPPGAAYALEFRNPDWDATDVAEKVAAGSATVCLSDRSGEPPDALPPGPIAYVRLRKERYTDEERKGWLDLFTREARSRHVYAFVKHEGGPANDPNMGVALARWMVEHA